MKRRQLLAFAVLLVAVVGSGIQVALVSHEVRRLHGELEAAQRAQDEHLAEHSRLLLERSALAAYQNVERLAEEELAMGFPDTVERIDP
jgi:cell division protein FtsL